MNTDNSASTPPKNKRFIVYAFIAAGVLALLAVALFSRITGHEPYHVNVPQRSDADIKLACAKHIDDANARAAKSIALHAEEFRQYIVSRKTGSRAFAEEITTLYGKWRAVKPMFPGTDSDGHKKYISEVFSKHLFSGSDLGAAMNRAIEGSVRDIEGIQNDLAVELRHEILMEHIEQHNIPIVQEEFRRSIKQMVLASQWDSMKDVANLAVSEIVSVVAVQIFLKLGVEANIISSGLKTGDWRIILGSIAVGLVVDLVWTWYDDPRGDIERKSNEALDDMAKKGSAALVAEMTKVLNEKSTIWNRATEQMIREAK